MGIFKKKTDKKQSASTRFVVVAMFTPFCSHRVNDPWQEHFYVINSSFFITNRASIGRWVDNSSKGLQASVGKYKAGVQRLSKADLHKITSTKIRQQDHWQVVAKCHQEKKNWLVQIVHNRLKKLPMLSLVKIIYQDNIWEQVSHDSTDDGNLKWIWEFWGSMQQSKAIMLNNVGFLVTTWIIILHFYGSKL